jgi:hypothetical protein
MRDEMKNENEKEKKKAGSRQAGLPLPWSSLFTDKRPKAQPDLPIGYPILVAIAIAHSPEHASSLQV